MKFKKIAMVALAGVMCFALAGCGGCGSEDVADADDVTSSKLSLDDEDGEEYVLSDAEDDKSDPGSHSLLERIQDALGIESASAEELDAETLANSEGDDDTDGLGENKANVIQRMADLLDEAEDGEDTEQDTEPGAVSESAPEDEDTGEEDSTQQLTVRSRRSNDDGGTTESTQPVTTATEQVVQESTSDKEPSASTDTEKVVLPGGSTESSTDSSDSSDSTEVVPQVVHVHNYVLTDSKDATCVASGYKTYTCECGSSYTTTIPATGKHNYVKTVSQAATCGSDGITEYVCSVCGKSTTKETSATGKHNYVYAIEKEATCVEDGVGRYTCSVCGDSYTKDIPATGQHNYVTSTERAATCTEEGILRRTCSVCGASYVESISANGHKIVTQNAIAPTCTKIGKTSSSYCSVCGEVFKSREDVPALGHDYDDGVITKEPTCTESGIRLFTCKECGHQYTESVDPTGHTPVTDSAVQATCEEKGLTAGSHCSVCGAVLRAQEETPALGHNLDSVTFTKEATCTESGIITYKCTRCDYTKDEQIPALGHNWVKENDATLETIKCDICSDEVSEEDEQQHIEKHIEAGDLDEGALDNFADYFTIEKTPVTTYKCSSCGETKAEYGTENSDEKEVDIDKNESSDGTTEDSDNAAEKENVSPASAFLDNLSSPFRAFLGTSN